MNYSKKKALKIQSKNNLPVVKCECGCEILIVPDLQAMNRAIENHILQHKLKNKLREGFDDEASRIRDLLTALVLKKAADFCYFS